MSTVGIILLVHTAFERAEQVIRHWVKGGCPVVVHVDTNVPDKNYEVFRGNLSNLKDVKFCERHRCEWGTWGMVAATQSAAELLLTKFPDVRHAYLASGSCLPLRPVEDLRSYLDSRPKTDFIESATTADVPWTVGGLDRERFTLRFPFSWKRHRRLFDGYVRLQRRVRFKRKIPDGLTPHMGSQWWCLTRQTLSAILQDPDRRTYDKYFQKVWIPDESYFQTLVRLYSQNIESRSLTLSKFDFHFFTLSGWNLMGGKAIFRAMQKIENAHLRALRSGDTKARVRIWTMADFIESPMEALQSIVDEMTGKSVRRLTEVPRMVDLQGFGQFLQNLKNQGMHPYLMGDFPVENVIKPKQPAARKPYLVRK